MKMDDVLIAMNKSECADIIFEEYGSDEYLVHTDSYFDDGDELHIVLQNKETHWVLTDEGHTLMWLSYEKSDMSESESNKLNHIISQNNVELCSGRISISFKTETEAGPALHSLIQALLQTSKITE